MYLLKHTTLNLKLSCTTEVLTNDCVPNKYNLKQL